MSGFCTTVVTKPSGYTYNTSICEYSGNWGYNSNSSGKLSQYDELFKTAGKQLGIDWKLVAAHAKKESGWVATAKNPKSSATGLFQFVKKTWEAYSKEPFSEATNPQKATDAYIGYMRKLLNNFKNAETENDKILLAIQSFHDGTIKGTSWRKMMAKKGSSGNKHTYEKEGINYIKFIMVIYKNECGGNVYINNKSKLIKV